MTTITVGEAVQACLGKLTQPTELRGSDGALLGYFTPLTDAQARRYGEAAGKFDPEVMRQRAAHPGPWLTTAEVVQRMESQDATK